MYKTVEEDTVDMADETLGRVLVRECWLGDSLATALGEDLVMASASGEVLAMDMGDLVMVVAIITSRTQQQKPPQKTTQR